ncbi:MAG: hypothetical protein JW914_10615 [Syntrophaceae bacterium]|nr:hypothetical protein [Syntrophaceae bacterium]
MKALIIQRWLRMFLLTIVSCSLCIILYPSFNFIYKNIYVFGPIQNIPIIIFFTWFIPLTLCGYVIIKLGGFRLSDLWSINSLRYPPTWLFTIVSASFYFLFIRKIWGLSKEYQLSVELFVFIVISILFSLLIASLLNVILLTWKKDKNKKILLHSNLRDKAFESILLEPKKIIAWLEEEKPISNPEEDLFDSSVFSKRLTNIFCLSPLKTVAIIGDYGCGKSSILRMTEYFMDNNQNQNDLKEKSDINIFDLKNVIRCEVSGWGLEKGAAAEHILNKTIKSLSQHVDCLGLINIPTNYRLALSSSGFWWSKIFAAISCSVNSDPVELLKKIDEVLKCIDKRIIIFLEDLDRNSLDNPFWNEVTSLLDRLKDLSKVSFVLSVNQDDKRQNTLLRIAEHTEYVPPLSKLSVIRCLSKFRELCFNIYGANDIYVSSENERDENIGIKKSGQEYDVAEMLGLEVNAPIDAMAQLLDNPRALKTTLRRTLQGWISLHGEIDFDTLLVARTIYTVSPEIYAFTNQNINGLRQLYHSDPFNSYSKDRISEIRNGLDKKWERVTSSNLKIEALNILIQFLFPGWKQGDFNKVKITQGVSQNEPTDYWKRLNVEEILENELRDQSVLLAIKKWQAGKSGEVYNKLDLSHALLSVDGFAEKVEQLGQILDGTEIRTLASEFFKIIIDKKEYRSNKYPGFLQLWRLALDKPIDSHEEWVSKEIIKVLPYNLQFANDIYYYWRSNERSEVRFKGHHQNLRKIIIDAAKNIYNTSSALEKALHPNYPYSIYQFSILFSSQKEGDRGFDPSEWVWLSGILLEAAKTYPQIIIPELSFLIVSQDYDDNSKGNYTIRADVIDKMFVDRQVLFKVISIDIDTSKLSNEAKAFVNFAQQYAKKRSNEK